MQTNRSWPTMLLLISASLFVPLASTMCRAQEQTLPGTTPLELDDPLDVHMVRTISDYAEQWLNDSPTRRSTLWQARLNEEASREKHMATARQRFAEVIGAVDPLDEWSHFRKGRYDHNDEQRVLIEQVRWPVMEGIHGEGVLFTSMISRLGEPSAVIILLPENANDDPWPIAVRYFADAGCSVLVMDVISRRYKHSGHSDIAQTNLPHREFVYRPAFELGRHVIGYEVRKVQAAVGSFRHIWADQPIAVVGVGEGGLIAQYAAVIEPDIDVVGVCGYFDERQQVWQEPIWRNVWTVLEEFGDAEQAMLIAPRPLIIEAGCAPEWNGPAEVEGRRTIAAPGRIVPPKVDEVRREAKRAEALMKSAGVESHLQVIESDGDSALGSDMQNAVLKALGLEASQFEATEELLRTDESDDWWEPFAVREKRQLDELIRHTQRLLHRSDKVRAKLWSGVDQSSVEAFVMTAEPMRELVHDELIGRLPVSRGPLHPRSRLIIDEPTHRGYELMLDVCPGSEPNSDCAVTPSTGFVAGGILLLPKDLKEGEKRPVVVCQHGLEGTPMDTITTDEAERAWRAYKGFSTQLVKQGFIVFAPQNPYRGHDDFRVIQRKSNPAGRSLFSYIIEQHRQILRWLATLPNVDAERIGFYGLSYGGKTAVRVPPLLRNDESVRNDESNPWPEYRLSICSADFNEWIRKNVSSEDRYSYVFTPEYEMFEWNMGHVAGYAELSTLMIPRPFMVERGHDDGVAPDEWVAWEYAKVRRVYDKLGLGNRTEIEWFNGPHTINGDGTFEFLHQHLDWHAK